MSKEKQMFEDLVEIFDEEYEKRRLITPQNTAEKMTAKGYVKQSEVAREIFEEIEKIACVYKLDGDFYLDSGLYAELKKKYTEGK